MITKRKEPLDEKDYDSIKNAIMCLTQVESKDKVESIFQLGNCGNFALCLYNILKPLYDDVAIWEDVDTRHVFVSVGTHAYDITGDITEDWKRKLALNDIIIEEYGEDAGTIVHVTDEQVIEDYVDNYSMERGGPIL